MPFPYEEQSMRWLSLLSFQTGEVAYRLKWVHPQPSAVGTSRMFLAGQHESLWWMAETRRHDIITTRLGIGAFYAEQAAESATSQHCPVNTPELPQPRGMEQMLRWLGALRTIHELHGAYAETIACSLEAMMQYSFCHLALMALAKAAAEPDPTGLVVRGAYTNVVSNSLFLYGHRLMLVGAKGMLAAKLVDPALRDALRLNQTTLFWTEAAAFGPMWPLHPATAFEHLTFAGLAESNPYLLPADMQAQAAKRLGLRDTLWRENASAHESFEMDEQDKRDEEEKSFVSGAWGPYGFAHSWNPLLWEPPQPRVSADVLDAATRISEADETTKQFKDSMADNMMISRAVNIGALGQMHWMAGMLRKALSETHGSDAESSGSKEATDELAARQKFSGDFGFVAKLRNIWFTALHLVTAGTGYQLQAESAKIGLLRMQAEKDIDNGVAAQKADAGLAKGWLFETTLVAAKASAAAAFEQPTRPSGWQSAAYGAPSMAATTKAHVVSSAFTARAAVNVSSADSADANLIASQIATHNATNATTPRLLLKNISSSLLPPSPPTSPLPEEAPKTAADTEGDALLVLALLRFYGSYHCRAQHSLHNIMSTLLSLFGSSLRLQHALNTSVASMSASSPAPKKVHPRHKGRRRANQHGAAAQATDHERQPKPCQACVVARAMSAQWSVYAAWMKVLEARSVYSAYRAHFFAAAIALHRKLDDVVEAGKSKQQQQQQQQQQAGATGPQPGIVSQLNPHVLETLAYGKEAETRRLGIWHPLHPWWLSEGYWSPLTMGDSRNPVLWPSFNAY